MSVKNGHDRDARGRIKNYPLPWFVAWIKWSARDPKAWRKMMHTRPRRRANKKICHDILDGIDPDSLSHPLEKKPHLYWL